tara:strand:+ start:427 stop:879 length:453 start_codon:yes stop_codon:yes gene_type:complete
MNIQELEIKCAELGAEIQRLKRQPIGVWQPKNGDSFWVVDAAGNTHWFYTGEVEIGIKHHNVYKHESLARKSSVLQRRSNLVIQACLNFDPHFVPDWSSGSPVKYGFYFHNTLRLWACGPTHYADASAAHVSTQEMADKVVAYLNSQEIK